MLRSLGPVRAYGPADVERALEVCAQDPVNNVFVAARILESGLAGTRGPLFAYAAGGERALVWCSANVVPVQASDRSLSDVDVVDPVDGIKRTGCERCRDDDREQRVAPSACHRSSAACSG